MRILLVLAATGLLIQTAPADEPPPPALALERAALDRFARARLDDARQLLTGPVHPRPQAALGLDCAALYHRRVALTQARLDHHARYWDDPRTQAAVFIGAIWTPAFYYLPYRALSRFLATERAAPVAAEIDMLRAASAAQRCFER